MKLARPSNGCFAALLLAGLSTLSSPAPAAVPPQPPAGPEAAASPTPQPERTSAVFGDWSVTCTQTSRENHQCEAALTIQDNARQTAVLALGRTAKTEPRHVVIQVPVNIRVASPVHLTIDAGAVVSVPFTSCNRLGCFADVAAADDLIARLRARPADASLGRIEWHNSADAVIALPLSTKGFAAALDNLQVEESR